jgi:predicted amidohydrolase
MWDPGVVLVACCQIAPRIGEPEANRALATRAVEAAVASGARIVVLPELVNSGYVFRDAEEARSLAEPDEGATTSGWVELARRHEIVIVGGFCELDSDGQVRNSAALVDTEGVRAVYRKAHLWDRESEVFLAGDMPPAVVQTELGRIAVMVCYDLEFPEWVRSPALAGAQLLAAPSNWPAVAVAEGQQAGEVVRVQANACVNRMFVAVCDRTGTERGVDWIGGSVIAGLDGARMAAPPAGGGEALVLADCDLALADDKRVSANNDVLADRRPELYGPLVAEAALSVRDPAG